jgi:uncharacterized protein YoxC
MTYEIAQLLAAAALIAVCVYLWRRFPNIDQ